MTATPVFPQTVKSYKVQILNADASNLKTIATGGSNGSKIVSLNAASTDTSNRDVQIGVTNGGTFYILGTVTIIAASGTAGGTPAIDLLRSGMIPGLPLDSDGNPFIFLASSSDTLQAKSLATVTTAKEIDLNAFGADF